MTAPAAELVLTKQAKPVAKPKKADAAKAAPAKPKKPADELRFQLRGDVMTTPSGVTLAISRLDGGACDALTRDYHDKHTLLIDGKVVAEHDCGYSDGFLCLLSVYKALLGAAEPSA